MTEPTDSVSTEDIERLVLVSNRLPFKKSWRGGRVKWTRSAGGLVTALDPVLRKTGGVWLGWGGDRPKQVPDREVKFFDVGAIKSPGFGGRYVIGEIPLTDAEVRNYYTGFANSTIWPLFHYFFEKCIIDADQWESYKEVNQIFAEAIANFARPDDLIWVQDYHLLLVPEYVHRLRADLKTHLFIHIPFPNYDILSILPWHVEILAGMTYASSVGFHDDRYLANFLASVERAGVAAVDEAQSCVRFKDGRKCTLYASGISIDFDHFDAVSRSSEARKARRRLRKQYGDMKLVPMLEIKISGDPDNLRPREPYESGAKYTDTLHLPFIFNPDARRVLIVGGGGGVVPTIFARDYPQLQRIDVVEIDPDVVEVSERYFGFRPDGRRIKVTVMDGRVYLRETDQTYDIIILDAFTGGRPPFHLLTRECLESARRRLSDRGVLHINIISALEGPRSPLFWALLKTMVAVFGRQSVYVFPKWYDQRWGSGEVWRSGINIELLALNFPTSPSPRPKSSLIEDAQRLTLKERRIKIESILQHVQNHLPIAELLPGPGESGRPEWRSAPVLTDDFAPVDNMVID